LSRKRLLEANTRLGELERACRNVVHDAEQFEGILAAFVSIARSVTHIMRREDKSKYNRLFPSHDFGLSDDDGILFDHMRNCRDETLKEGTLISLCNKPDKIAVHNEYRYESGQFVVTASPLPSNHSPLTLEKPRYYMSIAGRERDLIELCRRYLVILEEVLARFEHG